MDSGETGGEVFEVGGGGALVCRRDWKQGEGAEEAWVRAGAWYLGE